MCVWRGVVKNRSVCFSWVRGRQSFYCSPTYPQSPAWVYLHLWGVCFIAQSTVLRQDSATATPPQMYLCFLPWQNGEWSQCSPPPIHSQRDHLLLLLVVVVVVCVYVCTKVITGSVLGDKAGLQGGGAPSICFSVVSTVSASVKRQYSLSSSKRVKGWGK